jgi:plasmid maintenance system killer protein
MKFVLIFVSLFTWLSAVSFYHDQFCAS